MNINLVFFEYFVVIFSSYCVYTINESPALNVSDREES